MSFIKLCLIFLFSLNLTSFQNPQDNETPSKETKINQFNKNGKKEGKWIIYGKDVPDSGYPANSKIEEGYYKENRKIGTWKKYYPDGKTPLVVGNYINNRPNGAFVRYHSNGKIEEKGVFSNNKYSDSLLRFHENGQLKYRAFYVEGKEKGPVKYYHSNGKIETEYNAVDGKIIGVYKQYNETGFLTKSITYGNNGKVVKLTQNKKSTLKNENPTNNSSKVDSNKQNGIETAPKPINPIVKFGKFQPNGYNKIYTLNDELWQDGDFKDGLLFNGKLYVYDIDGILLKVKVFKNGVYHSDGQL